MKKWNHAQALKLLQLSKKYPLPPVDLNRIQNNLAIVYQTIGAYRFAIDIYENLYEAGKANDKPYQELFALYGLAYSWLQVEEFGKVVEVCQKGMRLREKEGISSSFGFIYACLGEAYLELGKPDSAIYFANLGVELSQKQHEKKELVDNFEVLANAYLATRQLELAAQFGRLGMDSTIRYDERLALTTAMIYQRQGKIKESNDLLLTLAENTLSIDQQHKKYQTITDLLADRFEQEKIEQAQKNQANIEKITYNFLFVLFILGVMVGGGILYQQRKNNQALRRLNATLNKKNEALHHFNYIRLVRWVMNERK